MILHPEPTEQKEERPPGGEKSRKPREEIPR